MPHTKFKPASFRILAIRCLAIAFVATPILSIGSQIYGIPLGTLTVTTPDPTLVTWPGESKPHHQMLATQTYAAASSEWYATGVKFDPHGTIGVYRYFQKRDPSTTFPSYVLEAASQLNELSKDMPANSGFNSAHMNQTFGPYEPYLTTYISGGASANETYGVETVELVFVNGLGVTTIVDYQKIDIYAATTTQTNDSSTGAAVKSTYSGDAPRVQVQLTSIYPATETWVGIYPQNGNPLSATKLANSDATSPAGDQSSRTFYVDPGNAISSSGTYVLQAFENTASGVQAIGQPTTFTINTTFQINSELGITK